jgi:tetratricopeptide (TPR) repeat protein
LGLRPHGRSGAQQRFPTEVRVSEPVSVKYCAFLSYSHRDTAWGKWLHAALESYRVDRDLVGRNTPVGPVPKSIRPIFRDREDFSAGHSLTQQTIAALEASRFLIVICSPSAAQSRYVNEEVRLFKMLGRAERVIPVIVDGEPGDLTRECFPPALRCKVSADAQVADEHEEPIAADAREQGDGGEIAKQKVVAGLLGLGLDEIVRRAERARRRRNRFWTTLAGVFFLLAVAASGSAAYAWRQLKINEAFLNATLKRATEIVDEAVAQAVKYNVPRGATLKLLVNAEGLFDDMAHYGRPTPELRYRKAWMMIQFALSYKILGDTAKQFARANEAYRLLTGLTAEQPNNIPYQRDLSVAYNEVGDVQKAHGDLAGALKSYRDGLEIAKRLPQSDPNAGWQRDLSVSYNKVGDVQKAQGDLTGALKSYGDGLKIAKRLAQSDPANAGWRRNLSWSHENVGDVQKAQGDLAGALKSYRDGFAIRERLAQSDAANAGWKSELSLSYEKVGDVQVAQGDLTGALESYRDSLAIIEPLAQSDPSNANWQRDLSVSYSKIGDVSSKQNNIEEATKNYRAGLAIVEHLLAVDSTNMIWQRDFVEYNYDLAINGDDPARRFELVTKNLTNLQAEHDLDKEQARWLHDAKAALSKSAGVDAGRAIGDARGQE